MARQPSWGSDPTPQKKPSIPQNFKANKQVPVQQPPSYHETPKWSLSKLDVEGCDGKWGWKDIPKSDLWDMLEKLKNYETMTWAEIERNNKRDHATETYKLVRPAQKRLEALGLADEETLFRFRLQGTVRVWGRKRGSVFEVLWYDPDHEICPSTLRNT